MVWPYLESHTIYGTRGGPWRNGPWGGSTCKGNSVFVHVSDWQGRETLRLPAMPWKILSSNVLTGGATTDNQTAGGIDITLPAASHDPIDTIIELKLDQPASTVLAD